MYRNVEIVPVGAIKDKIDAEEEFHIDITEAIRFGLHLYLNVSVQLKATFTFKSGWFGTQQ
ncbi:hypothetical protein GGD56_003766 [Rhizobium mongolense]|uniref:Uncharacterized protein n=2 Tax=Rhizobium mongolense TaxID=57676 RepID=A0A7W6WI53_9HYPH|nr:hypothetical protein [Rhizobium mongolense]MBB4278539.1 hypothetical protein [Rhizobium mongolense]TVZ72948.1 hypothetical protein BCL32_1139 [Rhizobium mongolense USDA 1844]